MALFTIELTSGRGCQPTQFIVEASTPEAALREALTEDVLSALFERYNETNDPNGFYAGWSRIVISLDGHKDKCGHWMPEHAQDLNGDEE